MNLQFRAYSHIQSDGESEEASDDEENAIGSGNFKYQINMCTCLFLC